MANIFSDILKGVGKSMTQYGRNMGQRLALIKLASDVKRVNPEDYATTEEYQRAMNASNKAYQRLQQEMETPSYSSLDKLLGISPEEVRAIRSAENVLSPQQGAKDSLSIAPQIFTGGVPAGLGLKGAAMAAGLGATRGGMGHIASSVPGEELEGIGGTTGMSALLGMLGYGAGEASRALSEKVSSPSKITETLSVEDIAKLPKKTRAGLAKQARAAGMWDNKSSESSNIRSFLMNREYAGDTAAQTLEKTTQGLSEASKLKQEGIEEIGGLSRGYVEQVKDNIRQSVKYSGLNATEKTALNSMFKVLDEAPTDAKTLDKIAQDWYKMGLTRAGEQKMTQSGLYKEGAKAIRDALKEANAGGQYTQAMSSLSQLLGTEDEGLVGRAAAEAAKGRFNIPFLSGVDIKVPANEDLSKAGAAWGRAQESGTLSAASPVIQRIMGAESGVLGGLGGALQYSTPYVGAIRGVEEQPKDQPIQQVGQPVPLVQPTQSAGQDFNQIGLGDDDEGIRAIREAFQVSQPQATQGNELKQALAMGILSGEISSSDATAILELLGLGDTKSEGKMLPAGSIKSLAETEEALNLLPELTGLLEEGSSAFGPLRGEIRSRIPWDKTGQKAKSTITLVRQIIGKGLEGGVLRKEDEYKYEQILPKLGDTEETVRTKIALLEQTLQNKYRTNVEAYQAGGYNPWYGFSEGSSLSDILGVSSY